MLMFAMRKEDSISAKMPAVRIKKTKVFESNFERQILDKKNAIRCQQHGRAELSADYCVSNTASSITAAGRLLRHIRG